MSRYKSQGRMLRIAALTCGISCLLRAEDPARQKVQVSSTQRLELAPGGTVRVKNSTGELTVEGWDQPGVEITTVKSTRAEYTAAERETAARDLDSVRIAAEQGSGEVAITTSYARRRKEIFAILASRDTNIEVSYRIRVPRDARLIVDHEIGGIYVDEVTGDVHASARQGAITLRLPQEDKYELDAKSATGSVTSDFPGSTKRRGWLVGHAFLQAAQAPHKLYLRTGFGDIIILRERKPQTPASLTP